MLIITRPDPIPIPIPNTKPINTQNTNYELKLLSMKLKERNKIGDGSGVQCGDEAGVDIVLINFSFGLFFNFSLVSSSAMFSNSFERRRERDGMTRL